ncbi:GGDEF domain-containing protein [Pulveribacter suum]|uniref:diguanylate cyclase n=1 Tax=Pulveribacter suum TaxID=2116657 RepID=A0A2P1NPD9_9BURK|nr:GGDEF domain-containing protein [Pulveribacter suum]
MTVLAALLMLCCIGAMYLAVASGLTPARPVHWWALVCCTGLGTVYGLIRSGRTRHWRDPAMTLFQNLSAMACVAAAYVIAGQARGIVLPILAVILMFGVFGLTPRQMVGVLAGGLLMFGAAVVWVQVRTAPGAQPLALAAAYLMMIAVVLLAGTLLNLRAYATRQTLRKQKAELARAVEQVRELATRDELTGLPNRRFMLEMMHLEIQRARRSHRPLLVAQLDLDHFKAVNDTHGHAAGDAALQAFARTVAACVRSADVLARWGGEEFVLLMGNTTAAEGTCLLTRLREAVAAAPVALPSQDTARLTVSIGAAQLRPGEGMDAVLQRADKALYAAKRQGRDRVVWAPGDAP